MTEKAHDKELEALKAAIVSLREELAGLRTEQSRAAAQQEAPPHGEESQGVWTDLLHKFESSRIQGEKVVRDLAVEVEKHPLVSIMAAFGLGYIIAKLWYQGNKQ
jgi:hypothetical protein